MASITDILEKLNSQNFGRNDSTIASSIRHPIKAAGLAGRWFQDQVNNAAGTSIPYDEANPFYTPDARRQEAAFNLAGMANLGSMPFAPKSAGGTLGTAIKPTIYDEAHEIARINAALPKKMGGLGLPENNTAMDRAKALGFDIDKKWFHGTNKDFEAFDPAKTRPQSKGKTDEDGAFVFSDNPLVSESYANYGGGNNSQIMPAFLNLGKQSIKDAKGKNWDRIKYKGDEWSTDDLANEARGKGKNAMLIKNVVDSGQSINGNRDDMLGTTSFVFDPSRIRSINAAFDPMKRNSANLLASIVGGTALANQYDKKKRKSSITDKMKGAK